MARARAESSVKQAELEATAQTAKQKAEQAGPLAAAEARMGVVEQETKVSELEAARREQQLQVEVVKPAQAERDAAIARAEAARRSAILAAEGEAEATKVRAEANAEATKVTGQAEGEAIKAKLTAEAEGLKSRSEALSANKEAVIEQQIAEQLPQIVAEAAKAFGNIGQLTVLNGAEGMGDLFREAVTLGLGVLPLVRTAFNSNGEAEEVADERRTEVH